MNYLKTCTDRLLIAINGYKTPKSVIYRFKKYEVILGNPQWQSKKVKAGAKPAERTSASRRT